MFVSAPIRIRLVWIFSILLLSGCGGSDMSDLEAYIAEVKARPKGGIKPLPEIRMADSFFFDPEGLRNPFFPAKEAPPPQVALGGNGIRPDTTRPREPLESFALDSLRMVGTVKKNGKLWALVQTADGTVFRVRTGNHMGRNYGRIVRITDDRIELVEIVPDGPGSWREKEAAVALTD